MKNSILKKAGAFLRGRRRCAAMLAGVLLVTSVTGYMPVPSAYASNSETPMREVFCGQEEHVHTPDCYELTCGQEEGGHTHTEECYETVKEMVCGQEEGEGGHTHTEECYDGGEPVCGQEEGEGGHTHTEDCYGGGEPVCGQEEGEGGHTHTEECYDAEGNLICGQEEGGHTHTDECYEDEEPTCGQEESEGHTHTGDCYDKEKPVCGQEEGEGGHEHTEDCYDEVNEAVCGQEESEGHTHTEACYGKQICELPEHTHEESCYEEQAGIELLSAEDSSRAAILPGKVVESGIIPHSDNIEWTITEDKAGRLTLTISGEGPMPDFGSETEQPWRSYYTSIYKIVIGDEITRVGGRAFNGAAAREVSIGKKVSSLGGWSFSYMRNLTTLTIPGNVKDLSQSAFGYGVSGLKSVVLEEGIEKLSLDNFAHTAMGTSGFILKIPQSVTSVVRGSICCKCAGFEMEGENESGYYTEDGVLYQRLPNGNGVRLVAYPSHGEKKEYIVPEEVTEMTAGIFHSNPTLEVLIFPEGIQVSTPNEFCRYASLKKVVLSDGVRVGNLTNMFDNCTQLEEIVLPVSFRIGSSTLSYCSSLKKITIPEDVKYIEVDGMRGCNSLEELTFGAKDCQYIGDVFNGSLPKYHLIISGNVRRLRSNEQSGATTYSGFTNIARHAESITFEGPNLIQIDEGALAEAPELFKNLSGLIYVDANGALYQCDDQTATATLIYWPDDKDNVQIVIPGKITAEEEQHKEYTITGIGASAFRDAYHLESIDFENAQNITTIGKRAFYGCLKLKSVNGLEYVEDVKGSFSSDTIIGREAFEGTALQYRSGEQPDGGIMDGKKTLTVQKEGADPLYITVDGPGEFVTSTDESELGGYEMLTGNIMNIILSTSSTQQNTQDGAAVYRVYFDMTEDDGRLGIKPGTTFSVSQKRTGEEGEGGETLPTVEVQCHTAGIDGTCYLEFCGPSSGRSLSFSVQPSYPSPSSGGGQLKVWGVVLTEEEAKETAGKILEQKEHIQVSWKTMPDEFSLNAETTTNKVQLVGDGNGNPVFGSDLRWKVTLKRSTADTSSEAGKDYVKYVEYTDALTLPEGISWKEEVLEKIQNQNIRLSKGILYAGDIRLASVVPQGSSVVLGRVSASCEGDQVLLLWRIRNNSDKKEIAANDITVSLYGEGLQIDLAKLDNDSMQIGSHVSAKVHYTHSEAVTLSSSERYVRLEKTTAAPKLEHTVAARTPVYFGEDIEYTVRLYNNGVEDFTRNGTNARLAYTLDQKSYLTPANMEKMFGEAKDTNLKVEIKNALLSPGEITAGVGGEAVWKNSANSDLQTVTADLTVEKGENGYTVTIEPKDEESYQAVSDTVESVLRAVGYAVTAGDTYMLSWPLQESESEELLLRCGADRRFSVYATAKDTFQKSNKDYMESYPIGGDKTKETLINHAWVYITEDQNKEVLLNNLKVKCSLNNISRETELHQEISDRSGILSDKITAENGEFLNYRLNFNHYGSGSYENLPVVGELCGTQSLLVPVSANRGLAEKNLTEVTKDGMAYYVLEPGNYSDIYVGMDESGRLCQAAEIVVEDSADEQVIEVEGERYVYTGRHTKIKWYYSELSSPADYQAAISYTTQVDMSLVSSDQYMIGSVVWMNDKPNSRLYTIRWGGGTFIGFAKKIVVNKGSSPENDELAEDDYSVVKPGDEVLYRLEFSGEADYTYVLKGSQFADGLPNNKGVFQWKKEDIEIVETAGDGQVSEAVKSGWELGTKWNGLDSADQQYIRWPEDATITLKRGEKAYLYIRLKYPEKTSLDSVWEDYCDQVAGDTVANTLYVSRFSSAVTHNLEEKGEVLLQKGVYGTYRGGTAYTVSPSRYYYNSEDLSERRIAYYVVLYNGGNKRFYLNDLYDELPDGFVYRTLVNSNTFERGNWQDNARQSIVTTRNAPALVSIKNAEGSPISWRTATISWKNDGNDMLHFGISGGGTDSVSYDETKKQYYLQKGEGIIFGYVCSISTEAVEKEAVNTIRMQYEDTFGTGVSVIDSRQVSLEAAEINGHEDQNNGTRGIDEDGNLYSDVTVYKGDIAPAVLKYARSYTVNGQESEYRNNVSPQATINWRVELHNTGGLSLTDYTFTGTLPAPYRFEGDIGFAVYDDQDRVILNYPSMLKISERKNGEEEKVSIGYEFVMAYGKEDRSQDVNLDGKETILEPILLNGNRPQIGISIGQEEGAETLKLRFSNPRMSIPEGGYAVVTLSSRNPSMMYMNKVFTNQAMLTPNSQAYENPTEGYLVTDEQGKVLGVGNSASANVSSGYATDSEVRVEQGNQWVSSSDQKKNRLLLSGKTEPFRYTMMVSNDTALPMSSLVMIDSLPWDGDYSPFEENVLRGSKFKVRMADDDKQNIIVTVKTKDGDSITLGPDQYTVEYTDRTTFTDDDWIGGTGGGWEKSAEGARSLRVTIKKDENGVAIPKDAKVEVGFNVQIDKMAEEEDIAEPGETAWNTFGYCFMLQGLTDMNLKAMPLSVGVKVPDVPKLEKQLVESEGSKAYPAQQAETFRFLIYEGQDLELPGGLTDEALAAKAAEAGRSFTCVSLTVEKGASSGQIKLDDLTVWKSEGGRMEATVEPWIWKDKGDYTVVELSTNFAYHQEKWNNRDANAWSFQYDRNSVVPQVLICTNRYSLYELPNSGGAGIFWHWTGGTLLLLAAVTLLYRNKYAGRC